MHNAGGATKSGGKIKISFSRRRQRRAEDNLDRRGDYIREELTFHNALRAGVKAAEAGGGGEWVAQSPQAEKSFLGLRFGLAFSPPLPILALLSLFMCFDVVKKS